MFGKNRKPAAKKAAISTHPAFPAVVALWFAALLGLGSLVLPVMLFESIATATGLSSVISAATPPLGMTARLLIAGIAAIAGAVAGVFIARKVAAAQGNTTPQRSTSLASRSGHINDPGQKRPISAHEELGSEYLDEPITDGAETPGRYTGRRRALAVTDDSGPSEYLETAPLPGDSVTIDPDPAYQEPGDVPSAEENTLDLGELGLMDETATTGEQIVEAAAAPLLQEGDAEPELPAEHAYHPHMTASYSVAIDTVEEPVSEDTAPQLTPREELAAMTDRLTNPLDTTPYNPLSNPSETENTGQDHNVSGDGVLGSAADQDTPVDDAANAPVLNTSLSDKSLSDLGVVELVERFALALQNKKVEDAKVEQPQAAPYNPFQQNMVDEADMEPPVFRRSNPEEIAPVSPAPDVQQIQPLPAFAQPAMHAVPSSLQPMTLDEDHEEESLDGIEDLGLSLNVSPNKFAKPAHAGGSAGETTAGGSGEYSSLLSLKSPPSAGQEFVRIDAEFERPVNGDPVVVFPGQELGQDADLSPSEAISSPEPAEIKQPTPQPRAFDAPQGMSSHDTVPASNNEAEQALRDALEKLQKMSGAA